MPTYECDDFRVTFARAGSEQGVATEYLVDVDDGVGRGVRSTFRLPMSATRLEEMVVSLGRSGSREIAPDQMTLVHTDAETLGGELGVALFDDVIGGAYLEAQRRAAAKGRGVRLTLSLGATPELLSVPWELLYRRPRFLASQRHTPIVRYLEVGNVASPLPIDGPVRVLGVVASPTGLAPLNVADERARVELALATMIERGLVELEWCDPATRRSLRQCLRDGTFHILHFVGHSDFDANGDGSFYLLDADGGPDSVTDSVLTALLGDQTSLRLVVLNSCKGARTKLTDPFSGIATSLVALGLPAVVAMQFSISDDAAIVFAEELFTSLIGRQYPIDAAVSEARKAVFAEVSEIEWATPVLFLRSFDGRLFEFASEPTPIPLKVAPAPVVVDEPAAIDEPVAIDTAIPDRALDSVPLLSMPENEPVERRSRHTRTFAIGAAAVVLAAGLAVVWFGRDDNAGDEGVVTASGTSVAGASEDTPVTTLAGAPVIDVATCAGQPLPTRPSLAPLSPEFQPALETAQHWVDLVASAQPGADNTAIATEIVGIFPTGNIRSAQGLDGFAGMEASYLLPVSASTATDGTTTLDVAALVYDNPTATTPCRTGFLCSRYAVSPNGTIASLKFTAAPPLESTYPYVDDRWFATGEPSPLAPQTNVENSFTEACAADAKS